MHHFSLKANLFNSLSGAFGTAMILLPLAIERWMFFLKAISFNSLSRAFGTAIALALGPHAPSVFFQYAIINLSMEYSTHRHDLIVHSDYWTWNAFKRILYILSEMNSFETDTFFVRLYICECLWMFLFKWLIMKMSYHF